MTLLDQGHLECESSPAESLTNIYTTPEVFVPFMAWMENSLVCVCLYVCVGEGGLFMQVGFWARLHVGIGFPSCVSPGSLFRPVSLSACS